MNLGLKDKVAIIGGSSKGLGKACALELAQEGARVVICANDKTSLEKTGQTIKELGSEALLLEVDMSSEKDNQKIVDETLIKFDRIDILVINSGGPPAGDFSRFENEDWEKAFNGVLLYVIRMYRMVIPVMKKNQWGRIINLTSLTVKEPDEGLILSNVFRSGVVSMAKTLSRELIKHNITINNICPGAFKTDRAIELLTAAAKNKGVSMEEFEREVVKVIPQGRYQKPEELGALVTFLCSERAGSITGTTIPVDGGMSRGLL